MRHEDDRLLDELEALYRARFHRFLRVAEGICGDVEAAQDAVQDAFARAVQARGQYRGDGVLEGWVWQIVINSARAVMKARPGLVLMPEPPDERASGNGHRFELELAGLVAALPERQRIVLFLRYYADLEYDVIAQTLGIAPGTVGATLNAARASLRRTLEEVVDA